MVSDAQPCLIELRGVCKQYGGKGGTPAVGVLHGIDLQIRAGEFIAIVGASGSGKSTLMNILGCLDQPSSGHYLFNGQETAAMDADALAWLRREAFGFVFQGYHLIATETACENVQIPAMYAGVSEVRRHARALDLLARLGLAGKEHHRPNQLSGGQQQRVSIARALMNGGRIVLADEPTGALDSHSGKEVMALLHQLADVGHTIILITHDPKVAQQAHRIVEIQDGCIVSDSGQSGVPTVEPSPEPLPHGRTDGMRWQASVAEAARSAWRGMKINHARTMLTLLGIVIGVASVIVMLGIGEGAKQRVLTEMGTMGTTIMYMSSKSPPGGGPRGELTDDDLDAIRALPQISRVMPVIGDPLTVRSGNQGRSLYVFASSEDMPGIHHWRLQQGRFFSRTEDDALEPVVVLGSKVAQEFFGDAIAQGVSPLGRQLLIANAPFEIIGIMAERGADSAAESYDSMVFIPYQAGRARVYTAQTQPDYVVVEATSSQVVNDAEQTMKALLLQRHGGREDFAIGNAAARLQAEAATRNTMTMLLSLIAAVSLVVGGIGVMNVMLMTVKERTREIGIRMATGARQKDIQRQFMTEAVLVTVTGGVAGVVIGLAIGAVLIGLDVPVLFSIRAMLGAFACAVATGLIFGFMPARTAAKLNPVVALAGQ